ncbi:uncharacterized protein LOC121390243 isoform X2 [Gigantopelta aegis]|uniref:uncharacterized protein LOC121390243 isoform X2 n=1 Tax=Gigantopelta aegis TaxID=1735272 RepID=UPI001B887FE1|nr:uncharacterized protein LOC121390243 isoform X2 [Gigantopelta aegis]
MEPEPPASENKTSSGDYSKYGITNVTKYTKTTAFGKTKTFAGLHPIEWAFLVISSVNILAAIGLTLYRMIVVIQDDPGSSDFTFTLLLLINAAFSGFYVIHGVFRERVYELYALIAAILVVTMYCILEYAAFNVDGRTTVKLVRVVLVSVLAPPNIFLAWKVARNFGYLEFKIVGASAILQNMYRQAAIFSCFLKMDLQAAISFVILALKEGTDLTIQEQIILGIGIPYSLVWSVGGWIMLRRELKHASWAFAVFGLVKPAYYLYKIITVYIHIEDDPDSIEETIVYSLLAAGAIALLTWFIIMAELVIVVRNFGQGLREKAFQHIASEHAGLLAGTRATYGSMNT